MRMLVLAIIALVTSSPAWAQQYPGGGIGGSYGTTHDGSLDFNRPAPAWQPQNSLKAQPAPRQNWNDNLGMKPGWNPQPAANAWERVLGVGD
jgi:hypothetical protein